MIKYKTSDIFRRAKQLADLEGSEFISWNESISLINEAWVTLYQKLIDKGDSAFIKEYQITSGAFKLPSDFWQLKGLFVNTNGRLQTIERRAENGSFNTVSYEIKNNVLYIYGQTEHVLLQYFAVPKTLFYKPNDISINLPEENIDACYDSLFITHNDNGYLNLYDTKGIKTHSQIAVFPDDFKKALLAKDYLVIEKNNGLYTIVDLASGYNVTIEPTEGITWAPVITENGFLYWFKFSGETSEIYLIECAGTGNYIKIKDSAIENGSEFVSDDDLTDFYAFNNGLIEHNGEDVGNFSASKIIYSKGECYFLRSLCFGKITADNDIFIIKNSPGEFIGFNHIDDKTGFGYTSKLFGKYCVCPYVEDTELDYPNSFFFQILAYMIAVSMKVKQGADATQLQNQLVSMEQTFFDTLGSDAYQPTRITNCY